MAASITGVVTGTLLLLNTLVLIGPMMLVALLKVILPGSKARRACSSMVMGIAETWAEICKGIFALMTPTQWDIRGVEDLRGDTSYLVVSNHQSWVDIPALVQAFNRKTPYFKFFLKKELIWVPFLGLAFWALDYPFMKRYSKAFLDRNPHLKGKDLEITRRACEKFQGIPVTVVNFLEGTRFTASKHRNQQSPYRHLLRPKAGGVAFVLAALFCGGFYFVDSLMGNVWESSRPFFEGISFKAHFRDIARGVIDTRDLVFFLSLIGIALLLANHSLESRRWRS